MIEYDDIYKWVGFGGKFNLASGKCRLRIFDLTRKKSDSLFILRPMVVVVSDVEGSGMTVRSCTGHIATCVVRDFGIDKNRMLFVEHYPQAAYGRGAKRVTMKERFDAVEFVWQDNKAIHPRWRTLPPPHVGHFAGNDGFVRPALIPGMDKGRPHWPAGGAYPSFFICSMRSFSTFSAFSTGTWQVPTR